MRKNNTIKRVCLLGLLFSFTNVLPSQSDDEGRWLNLIVQPAAEQVSHSYRASEVSKEERNFIRGVPENLENVRVSKNIFSLELNMYQLLNQGKIDSLVHVWGSWCKPCIRNMPELVRLRASLPEMDLIGICADFDKVTAQEAARKHGITWKNLYFEFDRFERENVLNIQAYPTYFVLGGDNIILGKFNKVEEAEKKLRQLLQGNEE